MMLQDYYERLGCSHSASYDEIKKNFQELALRHHPDKVNSKEMSEPGNHERETSEEFLLIMEAWETLRDEKKRKIYDSVLMRRTCDQQNLIYATLSWNELDFDGSVYTYTCRCGDLYVVSESEKIVQHEISVQCNGCSLEIIVLR